MASSPEAAQPGTTVPPPADPSPPPSSPLPESSPPPPVQPASPPPAAPVVPPPPLPQSPPATPPPSTTPAQTPPTPTTPPVQTPPQTPPPETPATPSLPAGSPPLASPPPSDGNSSLTPPAPASLRSPPRSRSSKHAPSPSLADDNEMAAILGIILGGVVALTIIILCLRWWRKRRRGRQQYSLDRVGDQYHKGSYHHHQKAMEQHYAAYKIPPSPGGWGIPPPQMMGHASSEFSYSGQHPVYVQTPPQNVGGFGAKSEFSYEALEAATGGFCKANLLGQGGFGFVHKGILPNGKEVAVKSLKSGSGQGEREFQAEVEIISRVHHRHLVSLVGYCIAGSQRMLVYEFVPNNTLEFHLHGKDQPVMDWAKRRRIAVGAAKGLAYLHEDCHPRIIHRDIKAANILLDFNFEAMVADFGLAKLTSDNYTHVSTRVMGTFGYLAPEYAASGKLTEKSDVFSFGVMLLELITGRRPLDPANIMEDSLVDWARPAMAKALDTGDYTEVVDPRLQGNYVPHEMARMISCAAASTRHSARRRPRMSQIVRALEGNSSFDDFNDEVKPGQSAVHNPYDTSAYNADMVKFRKMVMTSEEFTSSGSPSDYGLNASSSAGTSSCGESREMGSTSPDQNPKQ